MKKILLFLMFILLAIPVFATCPPTCFELSTPGNNVGLGSASPGQALDVQGTIRSSNGYQGILSANVPTLNQNTTGSAGSVTSSSQPAITSVGTLTSLQIGPGNVGISSTTPGENLDVAGTIRATTILIGSQNVCQANGTNCPSASATAGGGANAVQYNTVGSIISGKEQVFSFNGTNVGIGTTNGRQLFEITTGNLYMNGGNIGVGSLSPGQLIDVQGNVRATNYYGNGGNLTGLSGTISGLTTGDVPKASGATTIANGSMFDNGNIGIGSNNPGMNLDVVGTVRTSQMVVIGTGASYISGSTQGNVGIGTYASKQVLAPGVNLDVQGTVRVDQDFIGTMTPMVTVITAGATPAINVSNNNGTVYSITGLSTTITSMTSSLTGTATNGAIMEVQFTDNGTPQSITWGSGFASSGNVTLPSTTVASTLLSVFLQYNSVSGKWICLGFS